MKQIIMQGGAELTDTLQNTVLPYSGGRGARVCTPRMSWCCAIFKPAQWQWFSAVPSMSVNDEGHFHMSDISWPAW